MGLLEESKAKAEALAGEGYNLCKYGKYADALKLYHRACELDGDNFKYWYNAAVACDRIGDAKGMENACKKTIECDGTFIKGYVRLAKAYLMQDKLEESSEVIATGMLIAGESSELKALKEKVSKKLEEKSMLAAKQLENEMRTAAPPAPAVRRVSADQQSYASSGSGSGVSYGSVSTAVGGNTRPPSSPTRSPASQKPNHVVNLLAKRPPGGIPPHQRELPKVNNPQFGPPQVHPNRPPAREIPRLNNPHFGDSAGFQTAPRLAVPASAADRENGPEFKDQCTTFIVADTNVQAVKTPQESARKAPPETSIKKQPSRRRFPFSRKSGVGGEIEF